MKLILTRLFDSPTFAIQVNRDGPKYYLHERILKERCPYLKALLTSTLRSKEQETRLLKLDVPAKFSDAFILLTDYLYKRSYDVASDLLGEKKCISHARVYILADRFLMQDLKEYSLIKMRQQLSLAYPSTPFSKTKSLTRVCTGYLSLEAIRILIDLLYGFPLDTVDQMWDIILTSPNKPTEEKKEVSDDVELVSKNESMDPRRPMQFLLSHYTASCVQTLRANASFHETMLSDTRFLLDVLDRVSDGSATKNQL